MSSQSGRPDEPTVGEVLDELAALRLLDSQLRAAAPGSIEYEHAADAVDRKSQELMDRLRTRRYNGGADPDDGPG